MQKRKNWWFFLHRAQDPRVNAFLGWPNNCLPNFQDPRRGGGGVEPTGPLLSGTLSIARGQHARGGRTKWLPSARRATKHSSSRVTAAALTGTAPPLIHTPPCRASRPRLTSPTGP